METGSNKSLFTLISVVIFGLFLSLSYWLFQDEMTNVLASVLDKTSISINLKLDNDGSYPTDGVYFSYSDNGDGTLTITDYDVSGGKIVIIPKEINGLTVTKIGNGAFRSSGISKVTLASTITSIDHYAFAYNKSLKSVKLNEGLLYVGFHVFNGTDLSELAMPTTVTSLGHAFVAFNPNLDKLYIPNSFKESFKKNEFSTEPYSRALLNTYVWHEATNTVDPATYYESPILIFY